MLRSTVILGTLGLLMMAGTTSTAAASPVIRFHDRIDQTFVGDPNTTDDDLCGVPVTTRIQIQQNGIVKLDSAGHQLLQLAGTATATWTNDSNGLSVTNASAGLFRNIEIIDNPDGSTTIYQANMGTTERLITPDGAVAVKDSGRIVFKLTSDFTDPDNPQFSTEVVSVSGPHPEADSGHTLFCEVIAAALT
jgi:hypothetical protein